MLVKNVVGNFLRQWGGYLSDNTEDKIKHVLPITLRFFFRGMSV